jgi:uncharacterized protein (TIGR02266 family)
VTTNRRLSERIFTRLRLQYGLQKPDADGYALNISATGLFASTLRPQLPGTSLHVRLLPTGAEGIDLRGTVCWSQRVPPQLASVVKSGMGIRLSPPPPAYLDLLVSLAASKLQRAHPRVAAHLEVRYRHREEFLKDYTENISLGGLFIATREPLERGTPVHVELVIHDLAVPLSLVGRVAYRLDEAEAAALGAVTGIGVQITEIDPRTEETLRSYVQRITRLYE